MNQKQTVKKVYTRSPKSFVVEYARRTQGTVITGRTNISGKWFYTADDEKTGRGVWCGYYEDLVRRYRTLREFSEEQIKEMLGIEE